MNDDELKKALKGLKNHDPDYPADKGTAHKAELRTRARMFKKEKKGCPLTILTFFAIFVLLSYGGYWLYTNVVYQLMMVFMWVLGNS